MTLLDSGLIAMEGDDVVHEALTTRRKLDTLVGDSHGRRSWRFGEVQNSSRDGCQNETRGLIARALGH